MTAETQKKNHHHHSHHHHHHAHKKIVHLKSIERITSLPVVESAHAYYERIKNSNPLIKWSLFPAETGVWLAVGTAMPVVTYFEKPVSAVDSIVCRGLDVIEANLPVVTYPPEVVYNITKDYVTSKVVTPVLKRADSVKQLSISGANICGEMAANRLNNAIDVADKYVEKYLPDISDTADSAPEVPSGVANADSKTAKTIQHVNQFSRKLQRRLTRRTIAEAKALKQHGADTIRCLVYLVDLLARDPKAFMEKAKEMWVELSKDEPENQVPPANLDQLIAMLTREMARRVVHLTNYTGAKVVLLSHYGVHAAHVGALNAVWWADYLIKMMHLESAMDMAAAQITNIHHLSINLLERLVELVRKLKQESLKSCQVPLPTLPALPASPQQSTSQPPQQSPSQSLQQSTSQPPQQSPSQPPHTSPTSSTSSGSSSSSATLTNKPVPSQNGDTFTVQESNHETASSS